MRCADVSGTLLILITCDTRLGTLICTHSCSCSDTRFCCIPSVFGITIFENKFSFVLWTWSLYNICGIHNVEYFYCYHHPVYECFWSSYECTWWQVWVPLIIKADSEQRKRGGQGMCIMFLGGNYTLINGSISLDRDGYFSHLVES